ncbi:MAG: hypothetical protein GY862_36405 [Gammaproteobacteria bacterium]|nr:hypothetical protein [Gammaproteobacteria bacterium]
MSYALRKIFAPFESGADRPAWIPEEIMCDWDTSPYAYQTEEELMPAGGLHGEILTYLAELLRTPLRARGLKLLFDIFILYRNAQGIKDRIGPDFLLMPLTSPTPTSYDLDICPPPLCVIEVVSPKSHKKDLEDNVSFYMGLGIPAYLAIDAVAPGNQIREQVELHLWRKISGWQHAMQPDADKWFALPEMGLEIRAQGQLLSLKDSVTGELLLDNDQLSAALEKQRQRAERAELSSKQLSTALEKQKQCAEAEAQRAEKAERQVETEAQRAETAERRAETEAQRAEAEAQRAEKAERQVETEAQRAETAERRAETEAQRAETARLEIIRLKALLADRTSRE